MGELYVGTSGWAYDEWAGVFYPPQLKPRHRLAFYIAHFPALEINATFYRIPSPTMLDAWNRQLPADYHLVVKGPRLITHRLRLADYIEPLKLFFSRVGRLRALKVVLWQLPPSLHKDVARLEGFLSDLPGDWRHTVEFRHTSWWEREVADLLARHAAAFVAVSHPRLPADLLPTTDFLYLRFHGLGRELYRYNYSQAELAEWVGRLKPLLKGRRLYAFFNNTAEGHAPQNAAVFKHLLAGML